MTTYPIMPCLCALEVITYHTNTDISALIWICRKRLNQSRHNFEHWSDILMHASPILQVIPPGTGGGGRSQYGGYCILLTHLLLLITHHRHHHHYLTHSITNVLLDCVRRSLDSFPHMNARSGLTSTYIHSSSQFTCQHSWQ